jgi:hypothetical protein
MKNIITKFAVCLCVVAVVYFVRHSAEESQKLSLLEKSISGQAEVFWGKTPYHQYPPGEKIDSCCLNWLWLAVKSFFLWQSMKNNCQD